jgi:hypothetical protein
MEGAPPEPRGWPSPAVPLGALVPPSPLVVPPTPAPAPPEPIVEVGGVPPVEVSDGVLLPLLEQASPLLITRTPAMQVVVCR